MDTLTLFQYLVLGTSVLMVIMQFVMLVLVAYIYAHMNIEKDRRAEQHLMLKKKSNNDDKIQSDLKKTQSGEMV